MKYQETITLKNGKACCLRDGVRADGEEVRNVFNQTHGETDYLLTYPDENSFSPEEEGEFLEQKSSSENEIEIVAVVDGKIVGTAGIEMVGNKSKVRHRAEFGISILKEYWGLGIGGALLQACVSCAERAGYKQLELDVVAENTAAIALYRKYGFREYGRNPKGFRSRTNGYQELVYMYKDFESTRDN